MCRKNESLKRQRTTSQSPSPANDLPRFTLQNDSDDGTNARNGGKRIRGAAARNHKEKELRDERERLRAEAANKRKGRADRRRVDGMSYPQPMGNVFLPTFSDSDPSEEPPVMGRTAANKTSDPTSQPPDPPASSQVGQPDASPASQSQSTSHKKGGRPPHGRKGKLGKNQYTRDKDQNDGDEQSPGRSQSRDVGRGDENGHNSNSRTTNSDGKLGKSKSNSGTKITMLDMKRKVSAMLDFISRTQLEMAGESLTPTNGEATEKIIRSLAGSIIPMSVSYTHLTLPTIYSV